MIRETYLAATRKVDLRGERVLDISPPRKKQTRISPLAPSRHLLNDWNQDRIVWKDYVERYYQDLRESKEAGSLIEEIADLAAREDVWLVCVEKDYPCHRFLVKQVIERILVARRALREPEDYSESYRVCKNLTRSEIAAMRRAKKKPDSMPRRDLHPLVLLDG